MAKIKYIHTAAGRVLFHTGREAEVQPGDELEVPDLRAQQMLDVETKRTARGRKPRWEAVEPPKQTTKKAPKNTTKGGD